MRINQLFTVKHYWDQIKNWRKEEEYKIAEAEIIEVERKIEEEKLEKEKRKHFEDNRKKIILDNKFYFSIPSWELSRKERSKILHKNLGKKINEICNIKIYIKNLNIL
jgi:hypothetical protein